MLKNIFPSLRDRIQDIEQMEKSDDEKKIINTVKQFRYTNLFFSRSHCLLKRYIVRDMQTQTGITYTFLDVGAGGCEQALWLARLCKKRRLSIRITCLERDSKIVNYARTICMNYPEIRIVHGSVMDWPDLGSFDYIFSNHFLHHFSAVELVYLLDKFYSHTHSLYLMNDLSRSHFSYWGFYLFSTFFLRHSFTGIDGLMSIRKGFLAGELQQIIGATGHPEQVQVRKYMPGRLAVVGVKKRNRNG